MPTGLRRRAGRARGHEGGERSPGAKEIFLRPSGALKPALSRGFLGRLQPQLDFRSVTKPVGFSRQRFGHHTSYVVNLCSMFRCRGSLGPGGVKAFWLNQRQSPLHDFLHGLFAGLTSRSLFSHSACQFKKRRYRMSYINSYSNECITEVSLAIQKLRKLRGASLYPSPKGQLDRK
jgi:hypothetical protein